MGVRGEHTSACCYSDTEEIEAIIDYQNLNLLERALLDQSEFFTVTGHRN